MYDLVSLWLADDGLDFLEKIQINEGLHVWFSGYLLEDTFHHKYLLNWSQSSKINGSKKWSKSFIERFFFFL